VDHCDSGCCATWFAGWEKALESAETIPTAQETPISHLASFMSAPPSGFLPGHGFIVDCDPGKQGSPRKRSGWSLLPLWRLACLSAVKAGDHLDLAAHQVGRERRQAIDVILTPAVLDREIRALDKSALLLAAMERGQPLGVGAERRPAPFNGSPGPASPCALILRGFLRKRAPSPRRDDSRRSSD
jgi:hypothetical protein